MSRIRPILIRRGINHVVVLAFLAGLPGVARSATQAAETIDFNRDIRRILSDNCIRCHGPDEHDRKGGEGGKAGLRLRTRGWCRQGHRRLRSDHSWRCREE